MGQPKNAMEIFKILEKSNCKQCEESTCLVFAAKVFKGERALNQCPHVGQEWLEQYDQAPAHQDLDAMSLEQGLDQLKDLMANMDVEDAAGRLGGRVQGGRLVIKILGKDFGIDGQGGINTDIHVHGWILGPLLDYLQHARGNPLSGRWVPLRELDGGEDWARFFEHRCEKALKRLADDYTDLFEDMIHLFSGRQVEQHYQSDISLVLLPLPNLPMLICYWKPEDGMPSSLNIFFDDTAATYLPVKSIYVLATGMLTMFEKIALRHGIR